MDQHQKETVARVVTRLDRPLTRPVLGVAASVGLTVRNRKPVWVRPRADRWEHRLGDCAAASPNLLLRGPREWQAAFAEQWIEGYTPGFGDTVVDVGAGIGTEVYPLAKLVGGGPS